MNVKNNYGCLMAMVDSTYGPHVVKIGKTVVPSEILYTDPNDPSYGYDEEPHVTVKYGFTPDLTRRNVADILKDVRPFDINLKALNLFESEQYDVVKYEVEKNEILSKLRGRADLFANEDRFPEYNPHMTIAYVKPGSFKERGSNMNIRLPITRFKYSGMDGNNLYINL